MHKTEGANNINNQFTDGPPGTTVGADWLNAVQNELITVVENSGQIPRTATTESSDQLWNAIAQLIGFDVIVGTPTGFANLFERTGANAYKIKDNIKTVLIRKVTGDYTITSFLDGADTHAVIDTNNCNKIECEPDVAINVGDTASYLNVTTNNCKITNLEISGTGSVAAAVTTTFKLNANNVEFNFCSATNRFSNIPVNGFEGSATASHNLTSQYVNCFVDNIKTATILSTVSGFKNCHYLTKCRVENLEASVGAGVNRSDTFAFESCENLVNCYTSQLKSVQGDTIGYRTCTRCSGCIATDFLIATTIIVFDQCTYLLNCSVSNFSNATGGSIVAFNICSYVTNCEASSIVSDQSVNAFFSCNFLSGCNATLLTSNLSNVFGFQTCSKISACNASQLSAGATDHGFSTCSYISSVSSAAGVTNNGLNTYVDTPDAAIAIKYSCHDTWWT